PGHVRDELAHREPWVVAELLGQIAKTTAHPAATAVVADILSEDLHPAVARCGHRGEDADQGRLARGIGAQQAVHARAAREVDPVEGDGLAVPHPQTGHSYRARGFS